MKKFYDQNTLKQMSAQGRQFFYDTIGRAEIFEGKWNSLRGQQGGKMQIIIRAEGKQLIINKETGQLIDFYEGTSLNGFIEIKKMEGRASTSARMEEK